MATYTKVKLSGAAVTNKPIGFGFQTNASVHSTGTSSSVLDEVWLWVVNSGGVETRIILTVGNPSLASPGYFIFNIPAYSTVMVSGGSILLSGDGTNASTISVTDSFSAGDLFIYGYVNRITP